MLSSEFWEKKNLFKETSFFISSNTESFKFFLVDLLKSNNLADFLRI